MLKILGIRHHGPGSARATLRALEELQPDCLLVELPAEAEPLCQYICSRAPENAEVLKPPVALLIYHEREVHQAIYLPFASFSPEWVAIGWANEHGVPVRCIDLPLSHALSRSTPQASSMLESPQPAVTGALQGDPIAYIAQLAGYSDSERWWEATFEQMAQAPDIFDAILDMMAVLREEVGAGGEENLLREAWMRRCLRKVSKEGFGNMVVVCGAWHGPALVDYQRHNARSDDALFRGLKKVKTKATWIPWTHRRLTFDSGYGAGVRSPWWYELLFHHPGEATIRWMAQAAKLLREDDLEASTARVLDAVQLAETLAAMRGLPLPGIEELEASAIATICEGSKHRLALIQERMLEGVAAGIVPASLKLEGVPLLHDIERKVKAARLSKYWERPGEHRLGATKANRRGGIDLRDETNRLKSQLLHRLNLLGIPWGRCEIPDRHDSAGGFMEFWRLRWEPEITIRIIEAGVWGNTLEEACMRYVHNELLSTHKLPDLAILAEKVMLADLPTLFAGLAARMEAVTAVSQDVFELLETAPTLVRLLRYGHVRQVDTSQLQVLLHHLLPRICVGLPRMTNHLSAEVSAKVFEQLLALHHAIELMEDEVLEMPWCEMLQHISRSTHGSELLKGACTRLVFDKGWFTLVETQRLMQQALSPSIPPIKAAEWIEGFLEGSAQVLLYNRNLWRLLDTWLDALTAEHFTLVLPSLRRAFARFEVAERQRLLRLARAPRDLESEATTSPLQGPAGEVLPLLKLILGKS